MNIEEHANLCHHPLSFLRQDGEVTNAQPTTCQRKSAGQSSHIEENWRQKTYQDGASGVHWRLHPDINQLSSTRSNSSHLPIRYHDKRIAESYKVTRPSWWKTLCSSISDLTVPPLQHPSPSFWLHASPRTALTIPGHFFALSSAICSHIKFVLTM